MRKIEQYIKGVQLLREISDDMSIRQVAILACIYNAGDDGITQPDIATQLGIPQAAVSRNIRTLAKYAAGAKEDDPEIKGLDLIICRPDLYESRRLNCTLTTRGWVLMDKVLKCFEDA